MLNVLRLTSGVLKKLQLSDHSDLAKLLLISSSTSTTTSHQQSIELTKSYLLERESVNHQHHHHHCNKNKDSIDCAAQQKSYRHNQNVNENITTTKTSSSSASSSSSLATSTITTTSAAATFSSVIGSTGGINLKKSEWSSTKSQNQESIDDSIKSYIAQDTSNNNKMEKSCAEIAVISSSSSSTTNNSDVVNTKTDHCCDNKSSASPSEPSSSSSKGFEGSSCSKSLSSTTGKSCFASSLADILKFLELVGNLKHVKRTGWVLRDVKDCESISGHMYRMSMMTFLLDGTEGLDRTKCMELALVHDLAESLVGDITPFCGISKEEKKLREMKAMEDICKLIEPRGNRIYELFLEYEEGESPESKFVKDLDRLDMVLQAFEYEKRDDCVLKHQEFFDSTDGKFSHPFVVKLVNEIYSQRKSLAVQKQQQHQQHECQNGTTTSASDTNVDENVVHQKKVSSS